VLNTAFQERKSSPLLLSWEASLDLIGVTVFKRGGLRTYSNVQDLDARWKMTTSPLLSKETAVTCPALIGSSPVSLPPFGQFCFTVRDWRFLLELQNGQSSSRWREEIIRDLNRNWTALYREKPRNRVQHFFVIEMALNTVPVTTVMRTAELR
jgi:hypothetical protein